MGGVLTPRCGRPMLRFEAVWGALLDEVTCGRPAGHNGQCRSVLALARQRPKETARISRWRSQRGRGGGPVRPGIPRGRCGRCGEYLPHYCAAGERSRAA